MKLKTLKDIFILWLKGVAMGAANIVPGVSGGTIAFLSGIYERLINAIKSFNVKAVKLFFKGQWKDFAKHTDLGFLMSVFFGMIFSIIVCARAVEYLLKFYPIPLAAFFFGLILASSIAIGLKIKKWTVPVILCGIFGLGFSILFSFFVPVQTPDNLFFIFLSGLISICTMVLPGISGSYVLLLMGKYHTIISGLNELNLLLIAAFMGGAIVGLLSFVRLLSFLLKKWWNQTVALLTGFMVGGLIKIWPWKQVIETYVNREGLSVPLIEKNILPGSYASLVGNNYLLIAIICGLAGFLLISSFEILERRKTLKVKN